MSGRIRRLRSKVAAMNAKPSPTSQTRTRLAASQLSSVSLGSTLLLWSRYSEMVVRRDEIKHGNDEICRQPPAPVRPRLRHRDSEMRQWILTALVQLPIS